mgnify:CR=1 FL=1
MTYQHERDEFIRGELMSNKTTNGFVVFTRDFDSTRRHYVSRHIDNGPDTPDRWTPELSEATIFSHETAFSIARQYRRANVRNRLKVFVGQHGQIDIR